MPTNWHRQTPLPRPPPSRHRACIKAHKLALTSQRHFWHSLMHDNVAFKDLQRSFLYMDRAEKQATQVYRR